MTAARPLAPRYFIRDDDVGDLTDALRRFVDAFVARRIPVSYQIIPARLTPACSTYLLSVEAAHPDLIEFGQHGLNHAMTLGKRRLKREFGPERTFDEQSADILAGLALMKQRLGPDRRIEVFTPPQHKYDRNTVKAAAMAGHTIFSGANYPTARHRAAYAVGRALGLSSLRHHGISHHGRRRPEAPIADLSIAVAVDDGRSLRRPAPVLAAAVAAAAAHSDLVGLMFHHEVYDSPEGRSALCAIVEVLTAMGPSRFHLMAKLSAPGADG